MRTKHALLLRHLIDGQKAEEEIAAISHQSPADQERFWRRLAIMDDYLLEKRPSVAETQRVARALDISTRQLYRLAIKTREIGPVRALISHGTRRRSLSNPTPRSDPMVTNMVLTALQRDQDARISDIERFVLEQCLKSGIDAPPRTRIYELVHGLRQSGDTPRDAFIFGASIAIDQAVLVAPPGECGSLAPSCTFIIDRATRIVIGLSVLPANREGDGLRAALRNMRERIGGLLRYELQIARHVSDLRWIAPPNFALPPASEFERGAAASNFELSVKAGGVRRHGALVLDLFGKQWGPFKVRTRLGHDGCINDEPMFRNLRDHISNYASAWNQRMLEDMYASPAGGEDSEDARKAYDNIASELQAIFAPLWQDPPPRFSFPPP